MATIAGFECFEVEFNRKGEPFKGAQVDALLAGVADPAVTDLVVFSHGWNNDMAEARKLYESWLTSARACMSKVPALANRRIAFCGILWPSKRFADDDLIPSGAAAVGSGKASDVTKQIDDLKKVFNTKEEQKELTKLQKLVPRLEKEQTARDQFIEILRDLLADAQRTPDDGSDQMMKLPAKEVFEILSDAQGSKGTVADDEDGGAAGLGDFFRKALDGARNALNLTTYFEMKSRAGLIGSTGAHGVLSQVRAKRPDLRMHLVGHSFGGRLVTAIADGADHASALKFDTMTLLQAAFSHNGFGKKWNGKTDGFFRKVVDGGRVRGPILVTHTKNDKAVGRAYPIASRLNREDAAALGDANDRFGGIGRNGAQKTPEAKALKLLAVGGAYAFEKGKLHNLEATPFVSSHGDVAGKEVAYATLCAMASI